MVVCVRLYKFYAAGMFVVYIVCFVYPVRDSVYYKGIFEMVFCICNLFLFLF